MSMKHKLYLAGPMTGIPQFNFPAFFAAAEILRDNGHVVASPAEMDIQEVGDGALRSEDGKLAADGTAADTGYTFGDFLSRDVKLVADAVDAVACLPGWQKSKGARLEVYVALICDKPVYAYTPQTAGCLTEIPFESASEIVRARESYNETYKKVAFNADG